MRNFKIDAKNKAILLLISKGKYQAQIAKELNLSHETVNQRCKNLIKYGYIVSTVRSNVKVFAMTALSLQTIADNLNIEPQAQRPNGILIQFNLKQKPSKKQINKVRILKGVSEVKDRKLRGHTDLNFYYNDLYMWIEPQGIIVTVPDKIIGWEVDPAIARIRVIDTILPDVLKFERDSGLHIYRSEKGALDFQIIKNEIALTNNDIAKDAEAREEQIKVYDTIDGQQGSLLGRGEDGKLRGLTDMSLKGHEFEQTHSQKAVPDTRHAKAFLKDMYDGRWEDIKQITLNNAQAIDAERKWFRHHDELTVGLTKLVNQLLKERNQRKL